MTITIIAAIAQNRVIGRNNQLLWHIPEDMCHFRKLTTGHTVIMGRKTWESIPEKFRPLPNRCNCVISHQGNFTASGATVYPSIKSALQTHQDDPNIFLIGGGEIYQAGLPIADELWLTEIDHPFEGDTYFPQWVKDEWQEISRHSQTDQHELKYSFVCYKRYRTQSTK